MQKENKKKLRYSCILLNFFVPLYLEKEPHTLYASCKSKRNFKGILFGFDRPLGYIRAGAPIYQGARPNLCGRPPESAKMPSRSLLHAVLIPFTTGYFPLPVLV